jgi:glutamine amidotransferase PdxT
MIEITNRQVGPVQLLVKSKKKLNAFSTLIIPGRGAGKNVRVIEDEQMTEYITRAEDEYKLISTRKLTTK